MNLAILSFQPRPMYSQAVALASARGHVAQEFLFPSEPHLQLEAWKEAERLLHTADALVLPTSVVFIGGKPEWQQLLTERLASGLRLMLGPWDDHVEGQNRFLAQFGLKVAGIRLHGAAPNIVVRRSARTFRDTALLEGVESVDLDTAVLLQTSEPAQVVLMASGHDVPVDPKSDLPVQWPYDSHIVMAASRNGAGGSVLLAPTSVLSDPWRSASGYEFAAIGANARLAENVLGFLLNAPAQR